MPNCDQCYISIFPLICIGTFAGSYFVLYSSVAAFLIQKELIGVAMGLTAFMMNTISVTLPYFFGDILDDTMDGNSYNYNWVMIMLLGFTWTAMIFFGFLNYFDSKWGRRLNKKTPEENQDLWSSK